MLGLDLPTVACTKEQPGSAPSKLLSGLPYCYGLGSIKLLGGHGQMKSENGNDARVFSYSHNIITRYSHGKAVLEQLVGMQHTAVVTGFHSENLKTK